MPPVSRGRPPIASSFRWGSRVSHEDLVARLAIDTGEEDVLGVERQVHRVAEVVVPLTLAVPAVQEVGAPDEAALALLEDQVDEGVRGPVAGPQAVGQGEGEVRSVGEVALAGGERHAHFDGGVAVEPRPDLAEEAPLGRDLHVAKAALGELPPVKGTVEANLALHVERHAGGPSGSPARRAGTSSPASPRRSSHTVWSRSPLPMKTPVPGVLVRIGRASATAPARSRVTPARAEPAPRQVRAPPARRPPRWRGRPPSPRPRPPPRPTSTRHGP